MKYKRIGVLSGGLSRERDVSLNSGKAVADALRIAGYDVVDIDVTHRLDVCLRAANIDAAFIALHGRFGEDGTVQGMLEMMRIPYTGASHTASAIAIDKFRTRQILEAANLRVAPGILATSPAVTLPADIDFPVVVKPVEEGSSVGVGIATNTDSLRICLETAFQCSARVLVEKRISGAEIQVAILNGNPIGAVEIEPHADFYTYQAKYDKGGSTHHIPPRIADHRVQCAITAATQACTAVGCSGAVRVDLILEAQGLPVILEINTIPGMTETSLLPEIAAWAGIPFVDLVTRIIEHATLHVH